MEQRPDLRIVNRPQQHDRRLPQCHIGGSGGQAGARAIDKLGLGPELTDRDVRKIGSELDVDAMVTGTLDPKAHRLP